MSLTSERVDQLGRDALDPAVSVTMVDASELAELVVCWRDHAELREWAKRAVCFIGAVGQDEQADESADQLIFEAVAIIGGP